VIPDRETTLPSERNDERRKGELRGWGVPRKISGGDTERRWSYRRLNWKSRQRVEESIPLTKVGIGERRWNVFHDQEEKGRKGQVEGTPNEG